MTLVFGHAIYGEQDRGHRLLGASPSFPSAATLAGRMDMQGTPPPHTVWQPYLSAFAWNDHYVLARTMPDQNAARPGMVFSRAFAIPAASLAKLDDILGMFELLAALGDARDIPTDVTFQPASEQRVQDAGLIRALLADVPAPVVWPGQEGFEQALAGLWQSLWPAARLALTVRLAFSPTDIGADPPTLVTTPFALLTRWSGFTTVRPDPGGALADATEAYLAGLNRSDFQKALVDAFGDTTPIIRDVRQLVEMEGSLGKVASFADYLDALRLTGHLGQKTAKGEAIKRGLIDNSVTAMESASATEIRMARNLDLASFATHPAFWAALVSWAQDRLFVDRDPALVGLIIADAFSGKPEAEWSNAITKGIGAALARSATAIAGQLWPAILARPELLPPIVKTVNTAKVKSLEAALVARAPATIAAAALDTILPKASSLNLVLLHAVCCAAGLPPVEAIRRHLAEVDATMDSVKLAAREAKGADLLAAALAHEDAFTLTLAAEAAAEAPSLLKRLDISSPRWREIWRESVMLDAGAANGPSDPVAATGALLEGLIEGSIADQPLIMALSATPLADLSQFADRERLWLTLPEPPRSAYLHATAKGWLEAVERGDTVTAEPALAQFLASPALLEPVLSQLATQPAIGCALFRALPQLDEGRFSRWLREVLRRVNPLSRDDAQALGRFVASRSWSCTARAIADAITDDGRSDLRPSVDYIVDLIGMWRRYDLDESGNTMPLSAKWQVLEEVTVDLYGYGPGDGRLWQRAGGKDKDIPKAKSGAESWQKVFSDAKKGKNAIDIRELIMRMYDDYPHHSALRKLRWDSSFGVKR